MDIYPFNFCLIMVDMVLPSALPDISLLAIPMTLPMSFIPSALVLAMIPSMIFSMASEDNCSGKNWAMISADIAAACGQLAGEVQDRTHRSAKLAAAQ